MTAAASALLVCLSLCGAAIATTWLLSVLTREYSWVDRGWSVLPPVYLWVFAVTGGLTDPRLVVMAVLGTLWGLRLTFNFARKGGYRPGGEDYRWVALGRRMSRRQFALFNLAFISGYQNLLLLLITLPAWIGLQHPQTPFGAADLVATVLFLAFLAGETVADQQQWDFQRSRTVLRARGGADPGFLRSGLFGFSRHPNYFCEIAQWWVIAGFGAIAAGTWLQPGALGAVLLTLLFAGSTAFTESISVSRHPGYRAYQREVSALVPWPPRRPAPDSVGASAGDGPVRPGGP
ncbi:MULTISPECIES: DUF1295 domain-containing protein [Cryobacterium]|uniref:DUF1295 domain-containing protein n=1 Tax=Cryobacterium TaxID=69578 RepID=UPI000CD4566D|nr:MULTISPECIES: DUF1295 domain-containing protein [Cryobacterium]POH68058.1 hypothetical protein C3B60_07715 [Cryobacterium zongtaii]TFC48061.1 DUF1295 domain-containing protein [Cryobacterium sp. TMN-39-2]